MKTKEEGPVPSIYKCTVVLLSVPHQSDDENVRTVTCKTCSPFDYAALPMLTIFIASLVIFVETPGTGLKRLRVNLRSHFLKNYISSLLGYEGS